MGTKLEKDPWYQVMGLAHRHQWQLSMMHMRHSEYRAVCHLGQGTDIVSERVRVRGQHQGNRNGNGDAPKGECHRYRLNGTTRKKPL